MQGPDKFVDEVGLRSLVVAPLVAGMEVFGALGTFSRRPDAFSAPQIALVRSLAEHAAFAMANARLIAELDRSRRAGERQAVVERSLRELGTRISGARDPEAVVQYTIDEALRLLDGDGARIDIVDPDARLLRGMFSSGDEEILESEWPRDPNDSLEVGASGRAVTSGETYISRDYLEDPNLLHGHGPDTYVRSKGIHGVIATPLHGDQGPFGAITVWSTRDRRLRPRRRRPARDHRRPVGGRARPRAADRGAGAIARGAGQAGRGGAHAARDRQPAGDDRQRPGRPARCASSTRPPGCWGRSGRGWTSSSPSRGR